MVSIVTKLTTKGTREIWFEDYCYFSLGVYYCPLGGSGSLVFWLPLVGWFCWG
jgi:hypothetical protein